MGELEGRVVLVTGGARGLGAAICAELAEARATLLVADRSERAHETVQAARAAGVTADALIRRAAVTPRR